MRRIGAWVLLAGLLSAGGCGTQSVLLDAEGKYVFQAFDSLALPGEAIDLRARLQTGDLLQGQQGAVVRFLRDGAIYKAAETDSAGVAAVTFAPDAPGIYAFTAELSPNGLSDAPPPPQPLAVACRAADTPLMVVDLDKTLVAGGFDEVLIGDPAAMPGSPEVMRRLAERYAVVYLTHRPDYFGPRSKAWLRKHEFPTGPLLLSDIGEFLGGSGAFKTEQIRNLRERFEKVELGVGDKVSDAQSYHENGLRTYLILDVPPAPTAEQLRALAEGLNALSQDVQVVRTWAQIERGVFEGAVFDRQAAQRMLIERAESLEAEAAASAPSGETDKADD